jgi:predicted alpha/beta-fold hydrolase
MKRRLYGYSVSLGAGILGRYVINSGDKCVLDGVILYGLFFNFMDNVRFFRNTTGKLYDKAIGFNFYLIIKSHEAALREQLGVEAGNAFFTKLQEHKYILMDISE